MKKIPGTLYHIGITSSSDETLNLKIWYRNQIILEKSKLSEEKVIESIQNLFEIKNLEIPINRIEWIVKEELKELTPTADISFVESTVSEMLEEFQHTPTNNMKKIVLMGLSNAGKTCIYERVFEGKRPWELIHQTATKGISYRDYEVGELAKPMIWDLGGQQQYLDEYHGPLRKNIFRKDSILLYVIYITDYDRFENAKLEFEWSVNQILSFNPNAKLNVFLHKSDLIHDKDSVVSHIKKVFSENISHEIIFHLTSIFDESLFKAWSDIIRELSPKSIFINSILKQLKNQNGVKDALVIEKTSGLACGSTIDLLEEDLIIGMISLLIVTIDKITNKMELDNFREFKLKTDTNSLLITNINRDLLLGIILKNNVSNSNLLEEIEEVAKQVILELRKLWIE
ncbi:MAG: ADP-ribosylation factor-like protein [Candidatus Thorarchaeota archaeon]